MPVPKVDIVDAMVFTAVVREGGFSAAARALELPPSAVSRRIKRLEDALAIKLLHRTTRQVGLTSAGRVYYERIARVPRLLEEAERAIVDAHVAPRGTLRIAAPPEDGGVIWATLHSFLVNFPEVDIEIHHSLKSVDIIEQGIDVALRGGTPPDSADLTARLLWDSRMLLAASPAYLDVHGAPQTVEELADHTGVCMDGWAPNALRSLSGDRAFVRIKMHNRVRANSLETARLAALDGFGIAPIVERNCERELRDGRLVEVLPGVFPDPANFWLVYPIGRPVSAAARSLVQHLVGPIRAEVA